MCVTAASAHSEYNISDLAIFTTCMGYYTEVCKLVFVNKSVSNML
jgi:hypothetical protein